jgi:hypothetical protein
MNDQTDALINELKNLNNDLQTVLSCEKETTKTTVQTPVLGTPQLTEAGLSDFILKNTQELIENGLSTIKHLQPNIGSALDGDIISGYANIIKATTSAIETLNSIQLEKNKQKAAKELKLLDIESKKLIKAPANQEKKGNNLLIATREDIVKMLDELSPSSQSNQIAINIPSQEIKD